MSQKMSQEYDSFENEPKTESWGTMEHEFKKVKIDSQEVTKATASRSPSFKADCDFSSLPVEIMTTIFSYLPNSDFENCMLVDKYWNLVCTMVKRTRIVIFFRDVKRKPSNPYGYVVNDDEEGEEENADLTQILHVVREECRRPDSTTSLKISRLTLEEITNGLTRFLHTEHRLQLWIYGHHLDLGCSEIRQFLKMFQTFITHFTLVQSYPNSARQYARIEALDLHRVFKIVADSLECLEFSGFLPCIKGTNPPCPKLNKLRVLKFKRPKWYHPSLEKPATSSNPNEANLGLLVLRKILKCSPNIQRIENYLLPNDSSPLQVALQNFPNPTVLKSFYGGRKWNLDKNEFDNVATFTDVTEYLVHKNRDKVSNLTKLEVYLRKPRMDYNRFTRYFTRDPFKQLLEWNKHGLQTLKIQPFDFIRLLLKGIGGLRLESLTKLVFLEDWDKGRRKCPPSVNLDPDFVFPNLTTVEIKFHLSWLDTNPSFSGYFPPSFEAGGEKKCFSRVERLKIDPIGLGKCQDKLLALFPNITRLDLTCNWNTEEMWRSLDNTLPVFPAVWPSLSQLTFLFAGIRDANVIPPSFVRDHLPTLKGLTSLKFRFIPGKYGTNEFFDYATPDWMKLLIELLQQKIMPNLNVYVYCDWRETGERVQELREYFEPMQSVATFNF